MVGRVAAPGTVPYGGAKQHPALQAQKPLAAGLRLQAHCKTAASLAQAPQAAESQGVAARRSHSAPTEHSGRRPWYPELQLSDGGLGQDRQEHLPAMTRRRHQRTSTPEPAWSR